MIGEERAAYLFLSLLQAKTGSSIMSRLGNLSPADVMQMTAPELASQVKITPRASKMFTDLKKDFDALEIDEQLRTRGIRFSTLADADYPDRLTRIPDLPPALYIQGCIPEGPAVALVGSRKASPTGLNAARRIAQHLCERGVCVISGLALGIDAAAHQGALDGGGPTVGVLGCGIDVVYPRSNRGLFERVKQSGGIISEYYLGEAPLPWRFPARNRIIAGLADVLVVVEAAEKSGALITARHALESGRDVWAVPGPLGAPECRGSNKLLADGAGVLWDIPDFVDDVAPVSRTTVQNVSGEGVQELLVPDDLPHTEASALKGIGFEPTPVDEVARQSGVEMHELLSALALLELKGYVTRDSAGALVRRPVG
ncbi:MAG: DNA-processing protein DprA [Rubrobacteraceae bacterium]